MKRILSLVLSLAIVLSLAAVVGIGASAAVEQKGLIFSEDYFTINKDNNDTASFAFGTADGYKIVSGGLAEGTFFTLTSLSTLDAGTYDVTIYARARAVRPPFDIEVNGTVIGESIDTSNTVLGTNNDAPVALKQVTISEPTAITIKITGSAGASGWLYLNSIEFTKTTGDTEEPTTGGEEEEVPTVKTLFLDAYTGSATISSGCKFSKDHAGYDGSGFVSDFSASDRYVQFNEINIAEATYTFDIRFVNAGESDCEIGIYDNDTQIGTVTLAYNGIAHLDTAYSEWGYYGNTQSFSYTLTGGKHTLKFVNENGKAANIDSLTLVPNAPTITMDTGAAMRIDGDTDGIRFSATADSAKLNAFESTGVTITDCGMIVAPKGSNESLMTGSNAIESKNSDTTTESYKPYVAAKYNGITPLEVENAGVYTLVGSLVEIKTANKQYVAKAYIEYQIGDDTKNLHYIYSDLSDARSLAQVAYNIKNNINAADSTYYANLCEKHRATVDTWAALYENATTGTTEE